jgi:hypothetical protein
MTDVRLSTSALVDILRRTGIPIDPNKYSLSAELARSFVGYAGSGDVCFVVPIAGHWSWPGRAFGGLILRFASDVMFSFGDKIFKSPAAIISCVDERLTETFCSLALDVDHRLTANGSKPNASAVIDALRDWENLLRSHRLLTDEEETGLWGELTLIAQAAEKDVAIACWRGPEHHVFDFEGGGLRIECKTTQRRFQHEFSLDQLPDDPESSAYVASLTVMLDPLRGRSLKDLVDYIDKEISDHVVFDTKLRAYGYLRSDGNSYERRFVLDGHASLFPLDAIPRVRAADPGVSKIRFTVRLDEAMTVGGEDGKSLLRQLFTHGM